MDFDEEDGSETDYHKRLKKIKENYANAYEPWKEEDDLREEMKEEKFRIGFYQEP